MDGRTDGRTDIWNYRVASPTKKDIKVPYRVDANKSDEWSEIHNLKNLMFILLSTFLKIRT